MSRNNLKFNLNTVPRVRANAQPPLSAGAGQTSSIIPGLILLLVIVGLVAGFLYYYARDSEYLITPAEAKKRIKAKQIDTVLDVRTDLERESIGFYPNSVHIPSTQLDVRAPEELKNPDARILLYCNTGQRARAATEKLHELGYKNAVYIPTSHFSIMDEPK
jgi:rhodanese-related sulfurtransferase